jgi:type IV fimbrial biogenesis protein FimT
MLGPMMSRQRGFTLIELMVVIAVVGVLVTLAAPSFYDLILVQRLKSVTSQVVTDLQYARSEATARNRPVQVRFSSNASTSCYVIFTGPVGQCTCTVSPVCAPTSAGREIRTAQFPSDLKVAVKVGYQTPDEFGFDPSTGAIQIAYKDLDGGPADPFLIATSIDATRKLQVAVKVSGRPGVCAPSGAVVSGYAAC